MLTSDCRLQNDNPAQHFCVVSASLPSSKTEKFSKHFFNRTPQKFFQLRERKFFCFAFPLMRELRKRSLPPVPLRGGQQAGKIFYPAPNSALVLWHFFRPPSLFCPFTFRVLPDLKSFLPVLFFVPIKLARHINLH